MYHVIGLLPCCVKFLSLVLVLIFVDEFVYQFSLNKVFSFLLLHLGLQRLLYSPTNHYRMTCLNWTVVETSEEKGKMPFTMSRWNSVDFKNRDHNLECNLQWLWTQLKACRPQSALQPEQMPTQQPEPEHTPALLHKPTPAQAHTSTTARAYACSTARTHACTATQA